MHHHNTRHREHISHLATGLTVTMAAARFKAGGFRRAKRAKARKAEIAACAPSPAESVFRASGLVFLALVLGALVALLLSESGLLPPFLDVSHSSPQACNPDAPVAPHFAVSVAVNMGIMVVFHVAIAAYTSAYVDRRVEDSPPNVAAARTLLTASALAVLLYNYVFPLVPPPPALAASQTASCVMGGKWMTSYATRAVVAGTGLVFSALVVLVTDPLVRTGIASLTAYTRVPPRERPPMVGSLLFPLLIGPSLLLLAAEQFSVARASLAVAWIAFVVLAEHFSFVAVFAVLSQIRDELVDLNILSK